MTDDQRVESVVRAVRWLRDDGDALTFFEGWLRDEFHTRAEQAEVEVERLRNEVGAGIWVPAEQFLVLRAENEAMRAAMVEAVRRCDDGQAKAYIVEPLRAALESHPRSS